jgi:hypothetical protein
MPVLFTPSAQPGLRLDGDFGIGDGPRELFGGGRASLNLSYVTLNLGLGHTRQADFVWGGTAGINLVRGGARKYSLSLDGGYGKNTLLTSAGNEDRQEIPLGVGLALEPRVTGADVEPWIGVRAHVRRSTLGTSSGPTTKVGFGVSAGLNARTNVLTNIGIPIPNFGFHIAIDYLTIPEAFLAGRDKTFTFNFGLNYLIPIKGLPAHGIIGPKCNPFDPCGT